MISILKHRQEQCTFVINVKVKIYPNHCAGNKSTCEKNKMCAVSGYLICGYPLNSWGAGTGGPGLKSPIDKRGQYNGELETCSSKDSSDWYNYKIQLFLFLEITDKTAFKIFKKKVIVIVLNF